jgi:N-acetyl-gamma-glutamyl-phosphate reductase
MSTHPKIFVDGQEGTTGLRIHEYLAARPDLDILKIDSDKRKDPAERARLLNAADLVFLCLPEDASREALTLITNPAIRVIDASTAFRTHPDWVYGLPELCPGQRDKLRAATRVANPGCHATAFILSVHPLVRAGILAPHATLAAYSLTGYSGGGKKMIAQYEDTANAEKLRAPRPYALTMQHKHLPEMQHVSGLTQPPLFTPIVCSVYAGLCVETFLPAAVLQKSVTAKEVRQVLSDHYKNEPFVHVLSPDNPAYRETTLEITPCNGTNRAEILVFGPEKSAPSPKGENQTSTSQNVTLYARLDNLGKGASGAAIQNMNLMLGMPESTGLTA